MSQQAPAAELYLITPENFDLDEFSSQFSDIIDKTPVSCLQIRLPEADEELYSKYINKLAPLAHAKDIAVLLCDRADLVIKFDLDGVHLENDPSEANVKNVRELIGQDRSIGISAKNSLHTAMVAGEAGADYVSFGPLFPSPTKGMPAEEGVKECLTAWALSMELPCVAIGGLTIDNVDTALETGAEFIAPISGIWHAEQSPISAAATLHEKCVNFSQRTLA
ncbi:MAG: thiamine phosphate synthase [Alphaproteobacteria bacterium]|nr:thiamine phosphate synthase [Alphaproteobacteria bacterium]